MKIALAATLLTLTLLTSPAHAVGFAQVAVPDPGHADLTVGIWYPSTDATTAHRLGLFGQDVAQDGAVAGRHLPLVIISHGTGGGFEGHYDTALALAQAGFVVAAITHTGDNYRDPSDQFHADSFVNRTRHMRRVVDYLLGAWSAHAQIDADRVGIFGFSAGGATALITIGAVPDLALLRPYCAAHPEDWGCQRVAERHIDLASLTPPPAASWVHDKRIKAAVIAAPALGPAFTPMGLANITVPIQLWRGAIDPILPHPYHAQAIYEGLRIKPDYHVVENAGHFTFLAPCSEALARAVPEICQDAPGFDRAAFHATFNQAVVAFFAAHLPRR